MKLRCSHIRRQERLRRASQRGVALILALSLLAIITVLVVGFSVSARTERQSARSTVENERAKFVARAALEHATSLLSANIPQPLPPGQPSPPPGPSPPLGTALPYSEYARFGGDGTINDVSSVNWLVHPGLLTTIAVHTTPGASYTVKHVPLSTNPSETYQPVAADATLNPPRVGGSHLMFPSGELRAAWVPMLRDPAAAAAAANPIIGRYAFWIDDESSKINVNTAYGAGAGVMDFSRVTPGTVSMAGTNYPLGYPASVELSGVSGLDRNNLINAVTQQNGLTSLDNLKPPIVTDPAFLDAHRLDLTVWSRDLEFTVFGKSRSYLFRRYLSDALGSPLFQRFRDREAPVYFHGDENVHEDSSGNQSNPDPAALYYSAEALAAVLSRTDWPGMPARSFVQKWGDSATGQREADQVAWNIVAMGNFAACSQQDFDATVTPTGLGAKYYLLANPLSRNSDGTPSRQTGSVGTVNAPNTGAVLGPLSQKAMIPALPRPLLNEICLRVKPESYTLKSGATHYRLRFDTMYEFWLPPGYPSSDFSSRNAATNVGLTYLKYTVTQGAKVASQEDTKYINAYDPNGIRTLYGGTSATPPAMSPNSYLQVAVGGSIPAQGNSPYFYAYTDPNNNSGFNSSPNGAAAFDAGMLTINVRMRLFVKGNVEAAPLQLVPVWDRRDPGTAVAQRQTFGSSPPASPIASFNTPADDPNDYIEFQFDINPAEFADSIDPVTRSLELADPRLSGTARAWQPAGDFGQTSVLNIDSLGRENNATVVARNAGMSMQKIAYVDFSNPATAPYTRPPIGLFSCVATGMQRGLPGVGLKLQPSATTTELPDWLLLDLLAPTHRSSIYSQLSVMNSTAGKINLNAKLMDVNSTLLPGGSYYGPPTRLAALTALVSGSGASSGIAQNILDHRLSPLGGQDFGALGEYDYPGEICEIEGVADSGTTDWDRERLVRNLAGLMTTRSSVFSVWGVAQAVKKIPRNTSYGSFQSGDIVTGEKRFQAIVERYLWTGVDGSPGNAKTDITSGNYDTIAQPQSSPGHAPPYAGGAWETIDGPDAPTYPIAGAATGTWNTGVNYAQPSSSANTANTLATAYNPLRAVPKYRVIYFRYLDE